jgi:biotin carboxylase
MKKQIVFLNFRRLLRESIEAFRSAKQAGYQIILVAKNVPDVLRNEVDTIIEAVTSDITELERVKDILIGQSVAAVVCFTETAIESAAWLNNELGLKGMPLEAVSAARNKAEMRLRTAALHPIKTTLIQSPEEINLFFKEVGSKIILKPINSSGSQGIFTIQSEEDISIWKSNHQNVLAPQYDLTKKFSTLNYVGEEYLKGNEYSVEGFVLDHQVTVIGVTAKQVSLEYKLELRHIFPADLSLGEKEQIEKDTTLIINALGLNNTSFHLEGKFDKKAFRMIEVAARPAGDYIASHIIPNSIQYDFYGNLIQISLGNPPEKPGTVHSVSGIQFITTDKEGVFERLDGLEKVLDHPYVKHVFIEVPYGTDILLPPKNFRLQRLAAVVSSSSSHEILKEHFKEVKSLLIPKIV